MKSVKFEFIDPAKEDSEFTGFNGLVMAANHRNTFERGEYVVCVATANKISFDGTIFTKEALEKVASDDPKYWMDGDSLMTKVILPSQ